MKKKLYLIRKRITSATKVLQVYLIELKFVLKIINPSVEIILQIQNLVGTKRRSTNPSATVLQYRVI